MRIPTKRTVVGAVLLLAGIIGLNQASSQAANPPTDDEFKALLDRDVKNLEALVALAAKGGKPNLSKASHGIPSNAMMIAIYADSRIDGKNAANDAKMATLRDAAIKIAVAGRGKAFGGLGPQVTALSPNMNPAPGVNAKPLGVNGLIAAGFDIEELMYQFKKTSVGGLGVEDELKANSKKLTLAPDKVATLAVRVLAVCDYCESVTPTFEGKKTKKEWERFNKESRVAAQAVIAAAAGKNPKTITTALTKLDGACVACHEVMK